MSSSIGTSFPRARVWILSQCILTAGLCSAGTISYTGTLSSPEDTVLTTLDLAATGNVTLQTYGFGGGTNAANTVIPSGGFDSFVGLFSGTGPGALFIDGASDILSTYSPGCPPAGLVTVGTVASQCGDVNVQFTGLTAGTYTVLLSDAGYLPEAVFETDGSLGDGFVDFTGGAFQTCDNPGNNNDCATDTANWALDITTSGGSSTPTPEPASFELAGLGLAIAAGVSSSRRLFLRSQAPVGEPPSKTIRRCKQ